MSNLSDYEELLEVISAIPDDKVQEPGIPVDVFLQEAENLYKWSLIDVDELTAIGITAEKISKLPVRAGACREAQSNWFKDRYSQLEAQKEWSIKGPLAYDLRDTLVHAFRYAYRNDVGLSTRVTEIADGSGHADMIQDLNDLAVLGRENSALLTAIGFDLVQLDNAAAMADTMAELLATANGDKAIGNETKAIRDKAYTYLKELVDEIRDAGKYLFWRNPKRLKGYVSQYWKKANAQKEEQPDEVAD